MYSKKVIPKLFLFHFFTLYSNTILNTFRKEYSNTNSKSFFSCIFFCLQKKHYFSNPKNNLKYPRRNQISNLFIFFFLLKIFFFSITGTRRDNFGRRSRFIYVITHVHYEKCLQIMRKII